MAGLIPLHVQEKLILQGTQIMKHFASELQTEQDFLQEVAKSQSNVVIRSKLSSLGYDLQTSLGTICQILGLLTLGVVDTGELIIYLTLLLVLTSMPINVASQVFRKKGKITVTKGSKGHQIEVPVRLYSALSAPLQKTLESLSVNSFSTITAGIQFLLDKSFNQPLDYRLGRFYPAAKSDAAKVAEWEKSLKDWGDRSLQKLEGQTRKTEEQRRSVGAEVARKAATLASTSGGEMTFEALVDPDGPLSLSQNAVILQIAPSELLTIIANVLNAASTSDQSMQAALASLKTLKVGFGIRATAAYKPLIQEEFAKQLPLVESYQAMAASGTSQKTGGPPKPGPTPPPPPEPPVNPNVERTVHGIYSKEEQDQIVGILKAKEDLSKVKLEILEKDPVMTIMMETLGVERSLMLYVEMPDAFKRVSQMMKVEPAYLMSLKETVLPVDANLMNNLKEDPNRLYALMMQGWLFIDMAMIKNPFQSKQKLAGYLMAAIYQRMKMVEVDMEIMSKALAAPTKSQEQSSMVEFITNMSALIQSDSNQTIVMKMEDLARTQAIVGTGICFQLGTPPKELSTIELRALGQEANITIGVSIMILFLCACLKPATEEPVETGEEEELF